MYNVITSSRLIKRSIFNNKQVQFGTNKQLSTINFVPVWARVEGVVGEEDMGEGRKQKRTLIKQSWRTVHSHISSI